MASGRKPKLEFSWIGKEKLEADSFCEAVVVEGMESDDGRSAEDSVCAPRTPDTVMKEASPPDACRTSLYIGLGGTGPTLCNLLSELRRQILLSDCDLSSKIKNAPLRPPEPLCGICPSRVDDKGRVKLAPDWRIATADGLVADLGVSCYQLGFVLTDGLQTCAWIKPLALRQSIWSNHRAEKALADLIFQWGEERRARIIARTIVRQVPRSSSTPAQGKGGRG